ncbi:sensor histidine kinase [Streptomyces sp. NPDC002758]
MVLDIAEVGGQLLVDAGDAAFGEVAQGLGEPAQEAAQLLDTARAAVHRAAQLVTGLDDLSRLHAGALDLYLRPVDLNEALGAALDDLGPGGHSIVLRLPEQLPDVIADAALLTRALTALGADALRHSPPDRPPVFSAQVRGDHLVIRVADGMPEQRTESSTPPSRARGTRTAESLALRVSRDVAEAMDGTLETINDGSVFSVTLTLPSCAPAVARHPTAPGECLGSTVTPSVHTASALCRSQLI